MHQYQKRGFTKRNNWIKNAGILVLLLAVLFLVPAFPAAARAAVSLKNVPTISGGSFVHNKDGYWYYKQKNGKYLKSTLAGIGGKTYYFDSKKRRKYGMQTIGKNTYYFGKNAEGFMHKNVWVTKSAREVYYFSSTGAMLKGRWINSKGKLYYLNSSGKRCYGMITVKGKKYYLGTYKEGYLYKNKFIKYNGNWYFSDKDGVIATGMVVIASDGTVSDADSGSAGSLYYFDEKGAAVSGTKVIGDVRYTMSEKGAVMSSGAVLSINSDCAILVNAANGKAVYAKNEKMPHANASTTKILTAVIAEQKCAMNEVVAISKNAASQEPTKLYAKAGEHFSMEDMIYALLIPSSNDVAVAIAEHVSKSTAAFLKLMNHKAEVIGCTSTHFATPNGLDAGLNHYTTAEDLAKIAVYAYKKCPVLRKVIKTKTKTIKSKEGNTYSFNSTNSLLNVGMKGVVGMKTGYTRKAGHCFVGVVKTKKGSTYVSVVLGGSTGSERWEDSETLLSYAYNNL